MTNKTSQNQRLFKDNRIFGFSLLITALFFLSFFIGKAQQKHYKGDQEGKAYTNLNFNQNKNSFRFAIIGDRTGGHRQGIFPAALDMLNLLQPEFVVNVGDLIEGYVDEEEVLKSMWQEVDESLVNLEMPFFLVPGNHDINLDPSEKVWFDRVGTDRSYSHFVYKDVLFLQLSTEDPPKNDPGEDLEEKYERVKTGQTSPEEGRAIVEELETWAGKVNISQKQVDYFSKVLKDNPKVRWTFAFMHTPAWTQPDLGNFAKIEALLANRPYTVFAGHTHTYDYTQRNGRDYITMGMTGGLSPELGTKGNMDHITLVTMNGSEPVISNLLMNGILDKRGALPLMQNYLLYQPRQLTQTSFSLGVKTVPNLRDLGGHRTAEGAVVTNGLLYRSNQLSGITPEDMEKIAKLGLVNAFDLRTKAERESRPEELPEGVNYVVLDALADADDAGPAQLEKLMANPTEANKVLGQGKAEELFKESYRQFVSLPSAQKAFSEFFDTISDKKQLPAVFHCTTGKDRTGWVAASLLTLIGVPKDAVYEDYLKSNDYILPAYKKVVDSFVEAGGQKEIPLAILGVKKEYLDAAFEEMEKNYGSIENYFSKGLKISAEKQQELKRMMLNQSESNLSY